MEAAPQPKPWRLALVLTATYVLAAAASLVPAIMIGNLAWLWPAILALPWSLALVPIQMAFLAFHSSFPGEFAVILLCVLNSVLIWKATR